MLFCSNLGISEASREAGYECIFSGLPSENPCQKATVGLRNLHFHQVPTPEMILKQVVHRLCSGKHPPLPYPIWLIQVWKLRSPGGSEIVPKPLGNSLAQPDWTRTCALWAWAGSTLLLRAVLCGLNFLPFMYVSQPQVLPSLSWLLPPESMSTQGPERAGAQRTPDRRADVWNCSRTQIFSSFFFFLNSLSSLLFTRMCVC